jgi:hypothetical protein
MTDQPKFQSIVTPEATVVIYQRKTGEIVGYHDFAAAPGAIIPDRKEMEEIAVVSASGDSEAGAISRDTIATLLVAPSEIEQGKDYRVSADKRLIVTRADGADAPSAS